MKPVLFFVALNAIACTLWAQNVGINTTSPLKPLSVNGSLLVDQNNTNIGSIDSAALLFGTAGSGIFSNKNPGVISYNGLDFWTNNNRRMTITGGGAVGIALGASSPLYTLDVNGTIRSRTSLVANSNLSVDGNATIDGTMNVGGSASVATSLSVGGKGIVRSNSSTNLRMGFTSGSFNITIPAGVQTDIPFLITPFTGDNDDVRVSICQFVSDSDGGTTWGKITMTVHSVNPSNDQCQIRFFNGSSATAVMKGRLYLMSVATN